MSEAPRTADEIPLPGGDFRLFITRLSFQGMLSLGLLENPITATKQLNRHGARMIIDDLAMLRDKSSGNLDHDEAEHLDKVIRDLEYAYAKLDGGE